LRGGSFSARGGYRPGLLVWAVVLALIALGLIVWFFSVGNWGMVNLNTIPAAALHTGGFELRQPPAALRACELLVQSDSPTADTACPGFRGALSQARRELGPDAEIVLADCSIAELNINGVPCWVVITDHPSLVSREELCYADPRTMRLPPDFADTTPPALIRNGDMVLVDARTAQVLTSVHLIWRSEPPPTTIRGCG
jgi:hypothetical protein